ncbi:HAD family hydrolase [Uliginosibacterium sp. H3]|uniref:HAD family hydrolase n=1 Tax=Uliginosibacterium silvisoli TaxID=3114758 RepID=A0ABU6K6B7_9RHOO|nr:HAD family hydrolase [Uliginosibacterium sp. H3]
MKLALFDLDNTLLHGDSDHAWGEFLCERGAVDAAEYQARNNEFFEHYKAGTLDNAAFLRFVLAPLAAIPRAELDKLHEDFMQTRISKMMLAKGKDLVRRHIEDGELVAIVTATNAFVTGPIARAFGVSHLIATVPAQEHGRFTGEVRGTPAFKEGKLIRVEAWLESMALNWDSFEESWFYSDSLNDLPMLKHVTHPVAIDPDTTLHAHALAAEWPVMSLRG